MDGLAAVISVPVWIYLGYFFGDNIDLLMEYVHDVQKGIYLLLGVLVALIVFFIIKRKLHAKLDKVTAEDNHDTGSSGEK